MHLVRYWFWRAIAEAYSVFAGSKAAIHYRRRAGGIMAAKKRKSRFVSRSSRGESPGVVIAADAGASPEKFSA